MRRRVRKEMRRIGDRTGGRPIVGAVRRLLRDQGLVRSARSGEIVDRDGQPIPWFTYPAIEYLSDLDFTERRIFEFGAGNSTAWWRQRAAEVISIESDPVWCERMQSRELGGQGELRLATTPDEFVFGGRDDGVFDVVVIDGVARREPAEYALEMIGDDAMIILDNSDWLPNVHRGLRDSGLIPIDFHGLGPGVPQAWTTTVFLTRGADFWSSSASHPTPIGGVAPPRLFTEHDAGLV